MTLSSGSYTPCRAEQMLQVATSIRDSVAFPELLTRRHTLQKSCAGLETVEEVAVRYTLLFTQI
jgi:hypothetical protein